MLARRTPAFRRAAVLLLSMLWFVLAVAVAARADDPEVTSGDPSSSDSARERTRPREDLAELVDELRNVLAGLLDEPRPGAGLPAVPPSGSPGSTGGVAGTDAGPAGAAARTARNRPAGAVVLQVPPPPPRAKRPEPSDGLPRTGFALLVPLVTVAALSALAAGSLGASRFSRRQSTGRR